MQCRKKYFVLGLMILVYSSFLYSNNIYGNYGFNIDTVVSIMKLSLIEEGYSPDSKEFEKNLNNINLMIDSLGKDNFVAKIKNESPVSCIEITNNFLILHFDSNELKIPIEIIKNEIYSRSSENFDEILGFLEQNKLYFNFFLAYKNSNKEIYDNNNMTFFLVPFEKEV